MESAEDNEAWQANDTATSFFPGLTERKGLQILGEEAVNRGFLHGIGPVTVLTSGEGLSLHGGRTKSAALLPMQIVTVSTLIS